MVVDERSQLRGCTVTDWFTCSSNTTVFPLMFWCLDLTHRFRYVSALHSLSLSSPPINHPHYAMLCYPMLCHTPTSLFFSSYLFSYISSYLMLCYLIFPAYLCMVYEWTELNDDHKVVMIRTMTCGYFGRVMWTVFLIVYV